MGQAAPALSPRQQEPPVSPRRPFGGVSMMPAPLISPRPSSPSASLSPRPSSPVTDFFAQQQPPPVAQPATAAAVPFTIDSTADTSPAAAAFPPASNPYGNLSLIP